jgi:hypothetical protein
MAYLPKLAWNGDSPDFCLLTGVNTGAQFSFRYFDFFFFFFVVGLVFEFMASHFKESTLLCELF